MSKMIILRGLPASGKTTWRNEFKEKSNNAYVEGLSDDLWVYVSKDEIRNLHPEANEKLVHDYCLNVINTAIRCGNSIIIDNTNLNQRTVNQYTNLAYDAGYEWEIRDFDTDLQTCLDRNEKREHKVPKSVIIRMAMDAGLYKNPREEAYIFDLDGTLCDTSKRTHFVSNLPEGVKADWNSFFAGISDDEPNKAVENLYGLVRIMQNELGYGKIIFVSGRPERYRKVTEEWLAKYGFDFDLLLMRRDGDRRDDNLVKQDILNKYLKPYFNIVWACDDRDRVVKMWRANGITCFQVAEGNF